MSFLEKVTAAKKELKSKKAKDVKSPRTLAFDYFETEDRLNSLKGKDSESHKKIQRELTKLRKELDKNNVGLHKLDVFYKSYLRGKKKVKANYRIVSDVVDIKTGMAEAGFDLTDFNSKDDFKKILKLAGVKGEKAGTVIKDVKAHAFVWQGDGIKIYTGADPIRGISFNGDDTGEDAYASYIGLSGTPEMVKKIFDAIKKVANYKDANPTRRDFI